VRRALREFTNVQTSASAPLGDDVPITLSVAGATTDSAQSRSKPSLSGSRLEI
jgi:hypothetical protein